MVLSKRQWAEIDAEEVLSEHEELPYCAVTTDWNRFPRNGLEFPLREDIQQPSGLNPVPRALG